MRSKLIQIIDEDQQGLPKNVIAEPWVSLSVFDFFSTSLSHTIYRVGLRLEYKHTPSLDHLISGATKAFSESPGSSFQFVLADLKEHYRFFEGTTILK